MPIETRDTLGTKRSTPTAAAILAACAMLCCALLPSFAATNARSADRLVDVGTHKLQAHVEGKGTPTVVIDAGLGDQLDKLRPLQQLLARVTRVVVYNRAGYGQSEPGPLPRDAGREADELRVLLKGLRVKKPYVLVGHSLGALNVQVFASRHPDEVAGIVLLDPPPVAFLVGQEYANLSAMAERMTAEWQVAADSTANAPDPAARAQSAFLRMIASEHREMFGGTAKLVSSISTFGDIPLVVMAAGKSNPAFGETAEQFQKFWVEQSRALAAKSTAGRFVLAEESSHYLYLDVPDLVETTILAVVRGARGR